MKNILTALALGVTIPVVLYVGFTFVKPQEALGVFGNPFLSIQLSTSTATNGYVLSTDGTNNSWVAQTGGSGGGSNQFIQETSGLRTATSTDYVKAFYFTSTSTTNANTFPLASTTALTTTRGYVTQLANLTTDGFVKTGSSNGTLSIDTTTYESGLTASGGITRTVNDFAPTTGYNIPLTASTTNWNTFYDTPSTRITAGTNLSWAGNTLNATGDGVSNWTYNGSRLTPSTTVGIGVFASSTIGDGTGAGGLTINGGATTTLDMKIHGLTAGMGTNSITANTAFGNGALLGNNSGSGYNTGIGNNALTANTSGKQNTAIGNFSLGSNSTGDFNVAIGDNTAGNVTGSNNVAIGKSALISGIAVSGNVALGHFAGAYETGSNAFYVNNQNRSDTATDKTASLLYGTFNATPASQTLNINASTSVFSLFNKGFLRDSTGSVGAQGEVLASTVTGTDWVATSTLFSSLGTVTSVALTLPTGFSVSGSPVTTTGTLAGSFSAGYSLPLTASTTEGSTAYTWGNHAVAGYDQVTTAGDGITRTVNDFDCDTASGSVFGCLTSTDWNTFNGKQSTISVTHPILLSGSTLSLAFSTTTANTWSQLQTFGFASTTGISGTNSTFTQSTSTNSIFSALGRFTDIIANVIRFIVGANPTVNESGEVAVNSTSWSLSFATGTPSQGGGGEVPFYPPITVIIASSSLGVTTTANKYPTLPNYSETILTGICNANAGVNLVVGNGTASSSTFALTAGTSSVPVGRKFNNGGTMVIFAFGSPSIGFNNAECKFERLYAR
jgi:hypothetical protein